MNPTGHGLMANVIKFWRYFICLIYITRDYKTMKCNGERMLILCATQKIEIIVSLRMALGLLQIAKGMKIRLWLGGRKTRERNEAPRLILRHL